MHVLGPFLFPRYASVSKGVAVSLITAFKSRVLSSPIVPLNLCRVCSSQSWRLLLGLSRQRMMEKTQEKARLVRLHEWRLATH